MTATAVEAAALPDTTTARRPAPAPTPFRRVLRVELRKMFDTRSGFWLMASIVILSVIATGATIIFGDRDTLTLEDFASAVGIPMSVILPMIGVLSVTSEWSQRTALTTFTLVPSRGRTIAAKLINVLVIGVVGMAVAIAVGAVGNLVVSNAVGVDTKWDVTLTSLGQIVLASEIGMLIGFVLGLVIRSSAGAIVGYFVFALVLPGISGALAEVQTWWADNAPWFDVNAATFPLYDESMTGQMWAQLGVSSLIWLVVPGLIGLRLMLRSEVK
ncbi:ABC transporter permease subunit [Nocardioides humi]|uniref:ABC transporter permease n=1 Tax=Nocardioides humi TaxID=449461 RepID=A0ABN2APA2_9ACTN|nr:ABC transporter permease subunit [Nocardioides humi]